MYIYISIRLYKIWIEDKYYINNNNSYRYVLTYMYITTMSNSTEFSLKTISLYNNTI